MKSPDQTPTEPELSQDSLNNPQTFQLLMDAIDKRVANKVTESMDKIQQEKDRKSNLRIGIFSIFTILILGIGITSFQYVIVNEIKSQFPDAVEDQIADLEDKIAENVQRSIRLPDLKDRVSNRVLRLELGEGFSDGEADSIIEDIEFLFSQKTDSNRNEELSFIIEVIVDLFIRVDRVDLAMRLERIAPEIFQSSDSILQTMIQAQGRRLLADAGAPGSWKDETGSMWDVYRSYRTYAEKAQFSGFSEFYFAFELLLRHVKNQPDEELTNLIADLDSRLNDAGFDAGFFIKIMVSLATSAWTQKSNAGSDRISKQVKMFICQFKSYSDLLEMVRTQANINCI